MKFKIGDEVKFLNDKGGGIVSKIISSSMVNVAIEDGFEIPTLTSNLIKIESVDPASDFFHEKFDVEIPKPNPEEEIEYSEKTSQLVKYASKGENLPGIYFAYIPQDQQWMITGMIDVYIINFTDYDILYSFFLHQNKKQIGIDYGSIKPQSKNLIETIDRDEIENWTNGTIQIMFHKDEDKEILLPLSTNFKIKPSKFYKENNYQEASFLNEKAIIYSIFDLSQKILVSNLKDEKDLKQQQIMEIKAIEAKAIVLIEKYNTGPREAVIDLHIQELIDDDTEIESSEILDFQMNHFEKCLNSALSNHYRKLTFIHGVGNGVLKQKIIERLKNYQGVDNQSASMAKFGVGAIEVLIRHNR
ncbi:MAG: DUF2027 domain-containing protein [Bacteroidales bacterium]|nr:DUF2027 domain-containing protein [Bacteroidales bacterium]